MKPVFILAAMAVLMLTCGHGTSDGDRDMTQAMAGNDLEAVGQDSPCGDDALCHMKIITSQMQALVEHLRRDAEAVSDPQAKAIFETSAEAIVGLEKAMEDYEKQNEAAWTR